MSEKVIIGLSGGVDSAVAAMRLLQQGCRVEALFMKNWEEDDSEDHCAAAEDLAEARKVAECLDIPLHTVNFSAEYWDRVFAHFLAEYRAGRTPNPDILCNQEIKFRAFLDHALDRGADFIATGHYARIDRASGRARLLKGSDPAKDQSYFLYRLGQRALRHSLFPLGGLHKTEVRRLAADAGLPNHARKDSTGICFIGERRFRDFLARYLPAQPGDIVSVEGEKLGTHQGLMFHTIGQRQGLGIGGRRDAGGEPWYVVGKDLAGNRLLVAQGSDHPALFRNRLTATDLHWIGGAAPALPLACEARIRYRQEPQPCRILALDGDRVEVAFDQPQRAVTPGQAAVFYSGDECLGGGTIG
ncbi:MAG TPA: tRNA 2-thiouridine(34) synthase MnmA [Gammaproteobacteria bacterium]|nr:tRNA 2-thiouridine(34) synthase MnmA [Gammaproteobacteria bacterium]